MLRKGNMGKRERPPLHHGTMNVISSLLLCLTLGRLFFVLHPPGNKRSPETKVNRVPDWLPVPQQQPQRSYPAVQGLGGQQNNRHKSTSQSMAYSAGRRGDDMPAELKMQFSNNLRRGSDVGDYRKFAHKQSSTMRLGSRRASGGSNLSNSGSNSRASTENYAWGQGMRVLVYTMDSMPDVVAKSKTGGAAGEVIVRESLTKALTEAGVQVRLQHRCHLLAVVCRLLYEKEDGYIRHQHIAFHFCTSI